ncbi:transposase [Vibrio parahaemolyticus]|uniref:transposase n=1 Tax=Vibrio parahaemolyticus TaxID=670 RepID=UPI0039EC4251
MSRYNQASHVFWRCQYHIVWTPKYRFRILKNNIGKKFIDVFMFTDLDVKS